jgi:hypothetical protein
MNNDFTEQRYRELLEQARERYRFVDFFDDYDDIGIALWRHDVDLSPQRSLALAKIESEIGVRATYFVQLTSDFYSVFDLRVRDCFREIHKLGHRIGLHFDASFHTPDKREELENALAFEASVLSRLVGSKVEVFSLHNPTVSPEIPMEEEIISGLVNAGAPTLYQHFTYCSDSNGYWRHQPLAKVLVDKDVERVYVLTHPGWWQLDTMTPRERVKRCIDGRRHKVLTAYDTLLAEHGRPNIDGSECD